jgi:hypothetical protein
VGLSLGTLAFLTPGLTEAIIERTVLAPDIDERMLVVGIDFLRDAKLRGFSLERGGGRPSSCHTG